MSVEVPMAPGPIDLAKPILPQGPPTIEANFNLRPVDNQLLAKVATETSCKVSSQVPAGLPAKEPLGVLADFQGTWVGTGFNQIWRPKPARGGPAFTKEPDSAALRRMHIPDDHVLELNLTKETLQFFPDLKQIPNRGFGSQMDVMLNGIPYNQSIDNVTNPATGLGDLPPVKGRADGIHFEPGLWLNVPPNETSAQATVARMATIPHGTTLLAQGLAPSRGAANRSARTLPPIIEAVDTTPFRMTNIPGQGLIKMPIGAPVTTLHPAMVATDDAQFRLPQDLTLYLKAGTIDSDIIKNPNLVLSRANEGKKFIDTEAFTVSTDPLTPGNLKSGLSNVDFLQTNAETTKMTSTFWISVIEHTLKVPKGSNGTLELSPVPTSKGIAVPKFQLKLTKPTTIDQSITVYAQQIQYSQTVILHFPPGPHGFDWPHVSVATLVPDTLLEVPAATMAKLK